MILYDPTEGRASTAIPEIKDIGTPAPGLERATGADMAITKDDVHPDSLNYKDAEEVGRVLFSNLPAVDIAVQTEVALPTVLRTLRFLKAIDGGILVQRKSGSDLIGSIPYLDIILEKMTIWTRQPWLLVTGNFQSSPNGKVFVNGRTTDFSYNAMEGGLDAWQERGGYLALLEKDILVSEWLKRKQRRLIEHLPHKIVVMRERFQVLVGPDNETEWRTTLMTFKGVGLQLADAMAEQYASLANALVALSDPETLKDEDRPKGLGITTLAHARKRLGLLEGQRLMIETEMKK
jgi:hypothetical protein